MTSQTKGSSLSLDDLWVDRAAYRPGQAAHLHIVLRNWADTPRFARLNVRLGWLDELVWEQHQQIEIPPGKHDVTLPLQLPPVSFRGYGIDLTLREDDGHSLVQESTALDVLDDWMQAPRYGFLVQFAPGSEDAAAVVATLARYHINVVQFYDWMRSEEHTSELQSPDHLVCRLLLEKKKTSKLSNSISHMKHQL